MSWLGTLNFVVLQWLFVRLGESRETSYRGDGELIGTRRTGWVWIRGVVPLTGWWSSYWFVSVKLSKAELNQ